MKTTAKLYHAGCPICVSAEQSLTNVLDKSLIELEIVHLGEDKSRVAEAENAGVKSVTSSEAFATPVK